MIFHENILPFVLDKDKRDYVDFVQNRFINVADEDNAGDVMEQIALDINPREEEDATRYCRECCS